jgi:hypothetical protein
MGGYFYPKISTFETKDSSLIYYFSREDSSLHIYSNKNKSINLSSLLNSRIEYSNKFGVYVLMDSLDFIWVDSAEDDSLYHISLSNLTIDKVIKKSINNNLNLLDLIEVEINSKTNELLLGIYGDTKATYGLFEIQGDSLVLIKEIGFLPYEYEVKDMYVKSGMINKLNGDSFLISYYYSDSVDLYIKNEFSKRLSLKSDSSNSFKGFDGDYKDINAISKMFSMNQRYNQFFYDKKNKLYYRVFSFEKEHTGKIEVSKKWSLCIFDSTFTKIHEENFHDDDYFKGYILFIDSKLYIANSRKSSFNGIKDSSTVFFDSFKLKTN